jgi:opacity protein-like surface antigen
MKTTSLGLFVLLPGIVYAQVTNAADLSRRSEPVLAPLPSPPSWTGFYVGGQAGGILNRADDRFITSGDGGPITDPTFGGRGGRTGIAVGEISSRSLFSGLYAGYNLQLGSAVVGAEADVNSLGAVDDILASVRARFGFGGDQFLVYGTAGVTFLSLHGGLNGIFVGGNGGGGGNGGPGGEGGAGGNGFGSRVIAHNGVDRTGFVAGIGAEFKLSPQVGAGIEALYHAFDRERRDVGLAQIDHPHDFVTLRGRLTFYLNGADTPALGSGSQFSSIRPWAGVYAGAHMGGLHQQSNRIIDTVSLGNGEPGTAGIRGIDAGGGGGGAVAFAGLQQTAAITGGGHIGYNWQSQSLVFGAEADVDASSHDSTRFYGSMRGRLGLTIGSFLFYGTGGLAVVRDESVHAIFAENGGPGGNGGTLIAAPGGAGGPGGQALAFRGDETRIGLVVGAGLEAKVSDRITAGLEGLYYDFQEQRSAPALPSNGRGFISDQNASDAFVLRTRFSFALQP